MDAISLLKEDHTKVKKLLSRLEGTTERAMSQREEVFQQIENELKVHTQIEEEIFYPAFKEAANRNDEHLYYEAEEEHHLVDIVLPEMKTTDYDSEQFSAKAKVLKDLIEHHVEEEEEQMFPKARKTIPATELRELGEQLQSRKLELESEMERGGARTKESTIRRIVNGGRRRAA